MTVIKVLVFAALQIVLLPVCILGFVMVGVPQIFASKRLGLSGTAVDILQTRWIQHYFGGRHDPTSIALARHLPNMSHTGMCFGLAAVAVSHRLFGYVPSILRVPETGKENFGNFFYTRHLFFDRVFGDNLSTIDQVVFMGAGFDTRAFLYCQRDDVVVFELDHANMQRVKRDALAGAGLDSQFIRFVPVDFNRDTWCDDLLAAGFDPEKKTIFLWEGVTLYLDESEVLSTLKTLAAVGARDSIVAFDLYSNSFLDHARKRGMKVYEKTTGEALGFGMDFSQDPLAEIESLLDKVGLDAERIQVLGDKRPGKEPLAALVHARVQASH